MEFQTRNLTIKPFSVSDEAAVIALFTDETVKRTYMVPDFPDREAAAALFARLRGLSLSKERYVAGIYLDETLIGIVNETEVSGRSIELGYAIAPAFQNRGYGTQMLTGAIAYLFGQGFDEVVAGAFAENQASIRVMMKSGMNPLDRQEEIEYRGQIHRCVYYSVCKGEKEGL